MASTDPRTTLVCLFHHRDQATAALNDLQQAGIPPDAITSVGGDGQGVDALDKSELASLGMPDKDYDHLKDGIRSGGLVIAVASITDHVDAVEQIFKKHSAGLIDEVDAEREDYAAPLAATADAAIPVIDEELVVGKRPVEQGGVRLYRRVIEVPVQESIELREEHVNVDRRAVDRPVSDADMAFVPRTVELTETAEEAVVAKDARVVEEIVVGKQASEHTETITDTVRRTEVEVEEIPAATSSTSPTL